MYYEYIPAIIRVSIPRDVIYNPNLKPFKFMKKNDYYRIPIQFEIRRKWLLVMRNFLILFLACSFSLSASVLSQTRVALSLKNASFKELIQEIELKTDLGFIYNQDDVKDLTVINLEVDDMTVEEILDSTLRNSSLDYEIDKNIIIIKPLQVIPIKDKQQKEKELRGTVIDEKGMPLPGVTVLVKGTYNGTTTDIDGNYQIKVSVDAQFLTFSFIGMQAQELEIMGAVLNVTMESQSVGMDEVMVVAYGTQKKSAFTGSASVVKADALRESPDASMLKALQGKAAGVSVIQVYGQPGSMPKVRIRGIGSINGNKDPLYVIDGVPVLSGDFSGIQASSSVLSMINPEDIESQTVLKDAAATALYGSRGANGVIIITTKLGKAGKSKVNFSAEYGFSDFANPEALNFFNAKEYAEYSHEALTNYWLYYNDMLPGQDNYKNVDREAAEEYAWKNLAQKTGLFHPDDKFDGTFDYANMTIEQAKKMVSDGKTTDWKDAIFRLGKTQKYDLSISGGNDKTKFYSSFGYFDQEGVVIGSAYERFTGSLSLNTKINNSITLRINEKLSHSVQEGASDGSYYSSPMYAYFSSNPTAPLYLPNGSLNLDPGFDTKVSNPINNQKFNSRISKITRSLTHINVDVKFTDYLKLVSNNSIDLIFTNSKSITDPRTKEGAKMDGFVGKYGYFATNKITSDLLKFNKEIGKHYLSALVGFEYKKYNFNSSGGESSGFATGKLMYAENGATREGVYESLSEDVLISYLSKIDYSFDNKYYVSGSWRRDGSSRLSEDTRWGDFYSGSLGWVLSSESFLSSVDWLNFLKAKISYGTTGNLPGGFYGTQALYSVDGVYNNSSVISLAQMENNNLTWEKSNTWNLGLDYTIFDKITGTVEFFHKTTDGLINDTPLLLTTGFKSYTENKGSLINKGVDFEISSVNVKNENFSWSTDFNVSYLVSKIDKLDEPIDYFPWRYEEGKDMYSYYLREWAGVDVATGRPSWYKNTKKEDGSLDKTIVFDPSDAEKIVKGKGYADFLGGITNKFQYKNLDLSFLCTFSLGADLYDNSHRRNSDGTAIAYKNIRQSAKGKHWQKPGDKSEYSRLIYGAPDHGQYNSDRRLISGDYLKVKNVTLGYNLPKHVISKLKLEKVRFYFNATDVYTFYKYKHINPEASHSGSVGHLMYFPPLKTYRLGVNVNF